MLKWMEYRNRYKWHHEANLLPLMDAVALEVLAADIEKHGTPSIAKDPSST